MTETALLDALHKRWSEKHAQWLRANERKRKRLNGEADMGCKGKKGRGRGTGGRGR